MIFTKSIEEEVKIIFCYLLLLDYKRIQDKSQAKRLKISISSHLDLLIAAGELPLPEDRDMVADPLEQKSHQLVVFLPAQLQLLQPTQQNKHSRLTTTDRKALILLRRHVPSS